MTTFERLQKILFDEYTLPRERVTLEAQLEDLEIDSLGLMELLFKIEDAFSVSVPPSQIPLRTVGDVVAYIDTLIAEQSNVPAAAAKPS